MTAEFSLHVSTYPECAAELIAFRNANRAVARDRAYSDWRYLDRPCAQPAFIVWARQGDTPAGAISVFPHDYFVVDGEYPLGVIGDVSVSEQFRGRGIAGAMLEFLASTEAAKQLRGCLVLPNETAARSFAKAGWREIDPIARFAKQIDFKPTFARLVGQRAASVFAAPFNLAAYVASQEVLFRAKDFRAELRAHIGDEFDALWQRADKRGRFVGVRSARYLRWRYEQHPATRYRMLAISDRGTLCGYVMYRVDGGICYVDDAFCADPAREAHAVVGALLRHLRKREHVATVSVSMNDGATGFPWRRFGLIRRPDCQRVMRLSDDAKEVSAPWFMTAGDKDV